MKAGKELQAFSRGCSESELNIIKLLREVISSLL
jgi:hypothetical protein